MYRLKLLGGASLEGPHGFLTGRAVQRRRIALLAILAAARGQLVPREKLVAYLWPEFRGDLARRHLAESLSVLRKELGSGALVTAGNEVGLDLRVVACDLDEFQVALEVGDSARAVDLYNGPFLDGFYLSDAVEFERWAEGQRDRLSRLYDNALELLAGEAETNGAPLEAVAWWWQRSRSDPYNSRVVLRLMAALNAAGDRVTALRIADKHAKLLREDFGIDPDLAVHQFAERLRIASDRGANVEESPAQWPIDKFAARSDAPAEGEGAQQLSPAAEAETQRARRGGRINVWFGTNRAPRDPNNPAKGFCRERGGSTYYGRCTVFVPKTHRMGSVGSAFWQRWFWRRDDRLRLVRIKSLDPSGVWAQMEAALRRVPPDQRHAVVFIHGYNVSFKEAALRAGQIGYDLQVPSMAFFSWPSRGRVGAYIPDAASIEASEGAVTDFLVQFARLRRASSVHVIAHSMGNRGLLRAIDRIVNNAAQCAEVRFSQIILAAPDVDRDTFIQLASAYRNACERTTLYVSARDRALGLSEWLHGADRVGYAPPVTVVPGIDTVNVTGIDLTLLGHGFFATARPILTDMHDVIFNGTAPAKRFALRRVVSGRDTYWEMAL